MHPAGWTAQGACLGVVDGMQESAHTYRAKSTHPLNITKAPLQCHFYPQLASVPLAVYRNLSSEGQP